MRKHVLALLRERGVELAGICRYGELPPPLDVRGKSRIPAGARSAVLCAFPYRTGPYPKRNVAWYAIPDDYHAVAGGILQSVCAELKAPCPGERFAWFVDSSPVREVRAAARCGLGVIGKNGLLITERWGSYVFLGAILTTLALEPDACTPRDCPGCGVCIAACPTGALEEGGLRRERCRSWITQKKGALSAWEAEQIRRGGLAWGCDICQQACPMNTDRQTSPIPAFYRDPLPVLGPDNLEEALRRKAYGWRGQAVLRRNLGLIGRAMDK